MFDVVPVLGQASNGWWILFATFGFMMFWFVPFAALAFGYWRMKKVGAGTIGAAAWPLSMMPFEPFCEKGDTAPKHSGNTAFDEYRNETLRRLDDELSAFEAFRDRLRHAKDKDEFNQFLQEMRSRKAQSDL